jgi:putative membrane protein
MIAGGASPGMLLASNAAMRKVLIGLGAGLAAGYIMNVFARSMSGLTAGHEGHGAAPGPERVGRGAQPPQAKTNAGNDATVRVGSGAYQAVTGRRPARDTQLRLGSAVHYAFSASLGATYAVLDDRLPVIRAARGLAYGAVVWAIADEAIIPALGLSRGPRELSRSVLLFGFAAHVVYGLSLDAAYRLASSSVARS